LLDFLFNPEDGSNIFLLNIRGYKDYKALQSKILYSSPRELLFVTPLLTSYVPPQLWKTN
jgi:hypothetical protein